MRISYYISLKKYVIEYTYFMLMVIQCKIIGGICISRKYDFFLGRYIYQIILFCGFFLQTKSASIMNADRIVNHSIMDKQPQHIKAQDKLVQHIKAHKKKKKCNCYQYCLYNNWYTTLCIHCRFNILLKEFPEGKKKITDKDYAYSIQNMTKLEKDFLSDEHCRKANWNMIKKLQIRKSDILQNLMLKYGVTKVVIDIKMFNMMFQHWQMINNERWSNQEWEIMCDVSMDKLLPCERNDADKDTEMVDKYLQDITVLETSIRKICNNNNPSSLLKISAFRFFNSKGFNWEEYISYKPPFLKRNLVRKNTNVPRYIYFDKSRI